ncbi:MAG: hypothetical protein PHP52_04280 [Bacteroidales bacterium]|jgi:hypothetical protein|nr:hypothetical protein [Bacteroidales bacterium]MDY0140730.1 hypothetical protein [Bacteroidales bacterium]
MKIFAVVISFFFCAIPFCALSQEVDLYLIPENVETLIGNNENIYLDPVLYDNVADFPGITETDRRFGNTDDNLGIANSENILSSFDIDMELGWSKTAKFLNIPISYYYKDFELSVKIPFYIQRQVYYSHGYVSAYGLGDLVLSAAWKYVDQMFYNKVLASLSFPTGNKNKAVNSYLCPLGTGSYDLILTDMFQFNRPQYSINAILTYRYSGESNRAVVISYPDFDGTQMINYELDNGHTFLVNSSANYNITNFVSVFGGFSLMKNMSGKLSNIQTYSWKPDIDYQESIGHYREFLVVDAKAAVSATAFATDIVFVFSYPIYTDFKQHGVVDSRKFSYYIKLSRNIF